MKYLQPSFTLPVSDSISQEEWDRIFEETNNGQLSKQFPRWSDYNVKYTDYREQFTGRGFDYLEEDDGA